MSYLKDPILNVFFNVLKPTEHMLSDIVNQLSRVAILREDS